MIINLQKDIQQLLFNTDMSAKIVLALAFLLCLASSTEFYPKRSGLKANDSCLVQNCTYCNGTGGANTCTQCDLSYYLFNETLCSTCDSAVPGCIDCTSATNCSKCDQTHVYIDPTNCAKCSDHISNCFNCSYDSGTTKYSCLQCDAISELIDATNCTVCSTVINNCTSCTYNSSANLTTCSSCATNYKLDTNACVFCSDYLQFCKTCNPDGVICDVCQDGAFRIPNGTACTKCSIPVPDCALCNPDGSGNATCYECTTDRYLQGNSCVPCSVYISNCTTCASSNTTTLCSKCATGTYLNSNGTACLDCAIVLPGCADCTPNPGNYTCNACINTDWWLEIDTCVYCKDKILECLICSNTSRTCDKCNITSYRNNNGTECTTCATIQNCYLCQASDNITGNPACTQCADNFFLIGNGTNATCQACSIHIPNCTKCDVPNNVCLLCLNGFYIDGQGCSPCNGTLSNCLTCSGTTGNVTCTDCLSGYYVSALGTCNPCNGTISNCTTCVNFIGVLLCTSCENYLVLSPNATECVSCSSLITDCDGCTQDNVTYVVTCNHCSNGKVLTDNACKDSSASTIIIVSAVVGGVVLMGAGFAIFKCMKKRKGSPLTEEDYEKI